MPYTSVENQTNPSTMRLFLHSGWLLHLSQMNFWRAQQTAALKKAALLLSSFLSLTTTTLLLSSFPSQVTVVQLQLWVSCTFASHSEPQLTQIFCCLLSKMVQQLWRRPMRLTQIFCYFLSETIQQLQWWITPIPSFSWLLSVNAKTMTSGLLLFCVIDANYDGASCQLLTSVDCWLIFYMS